MGDHAKLKRLVEQRERINETLRQRREQDSPEGPPLRLVAPSEDTGPEPVRSPELSRANE